MTEGSIAHRAMRGAGWVMGWRMATRLLGLLSTLILVRLLTPDDFGLAALATAFAASVEAMSAIGAEFALIRERNPSKAMYNTAFTLNLMRGVATMLILIAAAWPMAAFLGDMRLAPVMCLLGVAFMLSALENIGTVDFRRALDFGKEFRLFLVPRIVGISANIATAFMLRSYWSLVIGIFVTRLCRMTFSYVMHPFRPSLSLAAWRHMFSFSFWLWANSLVALVRERADTLVLGRMLATERVGVFAIGSEIALLPSTEILEPASRTLYPGFAAGAHAGADMSRAFLDAMAVLMLLVLPAGFGISLVADPLVRLALGAKWLDAIPLVQVIALTGVFAVIIQTAGNLFGVRGETRLLFQMSLLSTILRVPLLVAMIWWHELVGAALGVAAILALEATFYLIVTGRKLHIGPGGYLGTVWRPALATAAMCAVLYWLGLGWTATQGGAGEATFLLLAGTATGATVFVAALGGIWLAAGQPVGAEQTLLRFAIGAIPARWRPGLTL